MNNEFYIEPRSKIKEHITVFFANMARRESLEAHYLTVLNGSVIDKMNGSLFISFECSALVGAVREPPLQAPSQWNRQVRP